MFDLGVWGRDEDDAERLESICSLVDLSGHHQDLAVAKFRVLSCTKYHLQ